jgi:Ca2+-binding EF-hand superfamily protein
VFGEQTTNEMCFAFFSYTFDGEHIAKGEIVPDEKGLEASRRQLILDRIFDHFDANHDGKLDVDELADVVQFFQSVIEDPSKKPTDPKIASKFLIAIYGKAEKGSLNREEFAKMAKEMK